MNKKFYNIFHINGKKTRILLPPPNITGNLHIGHYFNFLLYKIFIFYFLFKHNDQQNNLILPLGLDHAGNSHFRISKKKYIQHKKAKIKNLTKNQDFLIFNNNILHNFINILDNDINFILKILQRNKKIIIFKKTKDINNFLFTRNDDYINKIFFLLTMLKKDNCLLLKKKAKKYCSFCNSFLTDIECIDQNTTNVILYSVYTMNNKHFFLNVIEENHDKLIILSNEKNYHNKYIIINQQKIPIFYYENHGYFSNCMISNNLINILDLNDFYNNFIFINNEIKINKIIKYENIILNLNNKICENCKNNVIYINSNSLFINLKKLVKMISFEQKIDNLNIQPNILKNEIKFKWLNNLKDWEISRNIINSNYIKSKYFQINDITFDISKMDTWLFSSIHPMIVFGLNQNIDLLITGYDILFFWVIKMEIINTYINKKLNLNFSFKKIIIHGLLRDKKKKKFSKSLNNFPLLKNIFIHNSNIVKINIALLINYQDNKDINIDLKNKQIDKIITKITSLFQVVWYYLNKISNDIYDHGKKYKNWLDYKYISHEYVIKYLNLFDINIKLIKKKLFIIWKWEKNVFISLLFSLLYLEWENICLDIENWNLKNLIINLKLAIKNISIFWNLFCQHITIENNIKMLLSFFYILYMSLFDITINIGYIKNLSLYENFLSLEYKKKLEDLYKKFNIINKLFIRNFYVKICKLRNIFDIIYEYKSKQNTILLSYKKIKQHHNINKNENWTIFLINFLKNKLHNLNVIFLYEKKNNINYFQKIKEETILNMKIKIWYRKKDLNLQENL